MWHAWCTCGPILGKSYFCTVDGSTVPERPFPRGTSGASAILWAAGDRPRPVAAAMLSHWWATAVSAETAALQLALAWLVASPLSALPGFDALWTAILSLPHVDPWFHAAEYTDALSAATLCSFAQFARTTGLAGEFDIFPMGSEEDEGSDPLRRTSKSGPTAGTSEPWCSHTAARPSFHAHALHR